MTATLTPVKKRSALTKGQLPKWAARTWSWPWPWSSAPPSWP